MIWSTLDKVSILQMNYNVLFHKNTMYISYNIRLKHFS